MAENKRTWLATIVFVDIVKYSKESVADQIAFKDHFNHTVGEAISQVPTRDRIILDTGDGCAICFLGDPEDAMFCAISIRDVYAFRDDHKTPALYDVRMGINLGPVRVVKDMNARQNVIGDGINVGQRIMSFAGLNQIYVSRSFYEVIACLSSEYEDLFHSQGIRKDKHDREHAVYELKHQQEEVEIVEENQASAAISPIVSEQLVTTINSEHTTGPLTTVPTGWDPDILNQAISDLAPYLGVIAKALVKKASQRCKNAEELYQKLSDSLTDEQEKKAFLDKSPTTVIHTTMNTEDTKTRIDPVTEQHVWKPDDLHQIEHQLAEAIGPLAQLLVKKAAAKTASIEELYLALAEKIDNQEARRIFLNNR